MENNSTPFDKRQRYSVLLRNRNFLSLWLAQVFSQLADRVIFVVFVAVIANSFGAKTSLQSCLYIAFTIPAVLLTALAGVFVDRCNKKTMLIITNLLRALIIILLPFFDNTLAQIYILAFSLSTVTQFFVPAEASIIPQLVNKHQLLTANSIFTTTMMASIIFGFALGDPLINIFGLKSVHISIFVMFLIAAICLCFMNYKPSKLEEEGHKTTKDFFNDMKEGFIYTKNNPQVYQAMFKLAALFSMIVMLSILSIGLSQEFLYPDNPPLGAQKFVYIIAFSGVGMVLGSIMVGKLFRHVNKYKQAYWGFALIGFNMLLLGLLNLVPQESHLTFSGGKYGFLYLEPFNLTLRMIYTYIVAGFIGFGSSLIAIPVQTILQSSIIEEMRGKVFGLQFTLLSTASTLPVIFAALGADVIGILPMLIVIALPLLAFGVYNLFRIEKKNN